MSPDVEQSLSAARMAPYLRAAGGNRDVAGRLYVWNARAASAFHLPLQIAEVGLRNRVDRALRARFS